MREKQHCLHQNLGDERHNRDYFCPLGLVQPVAAHRAEDAGIYFPACQHEKADCDEPYRRDTHICLGKDIRVLLFAFCGAGCN